MCRKIKIILVYIYITYTEILCLINILIIIQRRYDRNHPEEAGIDAIKTMPLSEKYHEGPVKVWLF